MKTLKALSILGTILLGLAMVNTVYGFTAIVNGETVESQFYHLFTVEQITYDSPHVGTHESLIFDFWFNESQLGNIGSFEDTSYLGRVHLGYDKINNVYYIEEIVDVASNACDVEQNCWSDVEVATELEIFANELTWIANSGETINGETRPIMFPENQYPTMLTSENLDIVNNWLSLDQSLNNTIFLPMVIK